MRALLETFDATGLDGVVLVVDDASPDGTGLIADIAALRAAWREYRGIRNWEKTAHVGAHL